LNQSPGRYPLVLGGHRAEVTVTGHASQSSTITVPQKFVAPPKEIQAQIDEEVATKQKIFKSSPPAGDIDMSKIWFITGAGRGMGVDIAKAALAASHKDVLARLGDDDSVNLKTLGVSSTMKDTIDRINQAYGSADPE
jgi:hypothetical protein